MLKILALVILLKKFSEFGHLNPDSELQPDESEKPVK
jgi:hypothetical protein